VGRVPASPWGSPILYEYLNCKVMDVDQRLGEKWCPKKKKTTVGGEKKGTTLTTEKAVLAEKAIHGRGRKRAENLEGGITFAKGDCNLKEEVASPTRRGSTDGEPVVNKGGRSLEGEMESESLLSREGKHPGIGS